MYVYCPHTECVIVQCCNGFEDWTDKIHTENTKSPRAMEFNPQMHGGGVKCKNVASCTANTDITQLYRERQCKSAMVECGAGGAKECN